MVECVANMPKLNKINDNSYKHEQMSGSNSSEKVTISDIKKELHE